MTLYDLIFLAMLAVFCFYGFSTGALRQVVNLLSFFIAITLSAISRNFMARAFHLDTITAYVAAFIVFVALFIGIRYLGHALSDKLHKQKAAGYVDRGLGVAVGVLWTLTILGVFHLIFSYVTPIERQPRWFVDAKIHPLSVQCAKTIQAVLPKGTGMADKVAPEV
ncbi:CvpA family protein [Asticcacaulis solisilvae]|uniref:CvpA family protein n=1 Tax=Asticcacaulis solisilvae TaxID=1217274 RepID=UPI003FD7BF54